VTEISFAVAGLPPAKNEAKSMLSAGHGHSERVLALLRAAQEAVDQTARPMPLRGTLVLDVVVESPVDPPSDATNYLGGIADVLEAKSRRVGLAHLGDLGTVALYENDRQIQEVHYRCERGPQLRYRVRLSVRQR
jgi:hypothetical protein